MFRSLTILLPATFVLATALAFSNTSSEAPVYQRQGSIFSEISHAEVVEVTMTTDLEMLEANIRTNNLQPASFSFVGKDGQTVSKQVEIRPRGKSRRSSCSFPPLKVRFSKEELDGEGYAPYRSFKMVTHCLDDRSVAKENVLREYLSYKMYNALSEKSYRVQLLDITYIDSKKPKKKLRRYGFIIESTREMASRWDAEECKECYSPVRETISASDENKFAVFQYMIGNEDWNMTALRNLKLVKPKDGSAMFPVPYDFDASGMVDAPYARPNVDLKLKSVKDRVFMGWTPDTQQMKATLAHFERKRPQLEAVISEFELLSRSVRSEMLEYLGGFYERFGELNSSLAMK